jgi:hypothetical protein
MPGFWIPPDFVVAAALAFELITAVSQVPDDLAAIVVHPACPVCRWLFGGGERVAGARDDFDRGGGSEISYSSSRSRIMPGNFARNVSTVAVP